MKKWIIVALTLLLMVSLPAVVNATFEDQEVETTVQCDSINIYSVYFAIKCSAEVPTDSKRLKLTIPYSSYHIVGVGNSDSYVSFRDVAEEEVVNFDLVALIGSQFAGVHDINLQSYMTDQERNDSVAINIWIMQTYEATPEGYVAFMTANTKTVFVTNVWTYDRYLPVSHYVVDNAPYLYSSISIPLDAGNMVVSFKPGYTVAQLGDKTSQIIFNDSQGTEIITVDFADICSLTNGLCRFSFESLGLDIGETYYMEFILYQSYGTLPSSQYVLDMEQNNAVYFNVGAWYRFNFYVSGVLWQTGFFDTLIEQPSDPDDVGLFVFKHWVDRFGNKFDFDTTPDENQFIDTPYDYPYINLYAFFQLVSSVDVDPTDPTPDESDLMDVLAILGMDNTIGQIFFWLILTGLVTVAMVLVKLPMVVIGLVNIVITLFFSLSGMLPLIVQILIYVGLLAVMFFGLRGGQEYE